MVSEPSDFNLLIQKDFSEQVGMNNEPLQSGSTHDNTFGQMIELRRLRFHFLLSLRLSWNVEMCPKEKIWLSDVNEIWHLTNCSYLQAMDLG